MTDVSLANRIFYMLKKIGFHFILAAVTLSAVTYGCVSRGSGSGSSDVVDSLSADTPVDSTVEIIPLADTVYPSVANVKFRVEIADSAPGDLCSLSDLYADAPGAFTFRRGSRRDADFGGHLDSVPTHLSVDWTFETDEDFTPTKVGTWGGGTGWTGQPIYVCWPDSLLARFKQNNLEASRREIMVGSLCGRVYFIDFDSGRASRKSIDTRNPIKGTISLDPTLNGNLYVGQGLSAHAPVGAHVIDLFSHRSTHFFGADPKAQRRWEAYDSSPVRVGQFLFRPGENGTIYKFMVSPGSLRLHSALRYTVAGSAPGVEASMSVYRNYGFTADNHGNILCLNLNNLNPVWHYKLPDDTDSTPIVAEEADGVYIYTGCEVEHEGVTRATYVKLDALTGREVWVNRVEAQRKNIGEKHFDGGYYSTALLGSGNCEGMLFVNVVKNTDGQNGAFIAIDRATGQTLYSTPLKRYAWSSPVGFLTPDRKLYVVTADCIGNMYLIEGLSGRIIDCKPVGNNFESSPVVVDNTLVVGSRGKTIYKVSVR